MAFADFSLETQKRPEHDFSIFGKAQLTRKTAFLNSKVLASAEDLLASRKKLYARRPAFVPNFH